MRILLAAAFAAIALPAAGADVGSGLTLTLQNVREARGHLVVALYDSEAAYRAGAAPIRRTTTAAQPGAVEVQWTDLRPGVYAAVAYHDRDSDGRLDTLPIGLPTEPFAISNDAPARFGPPRWRAARFELLPGDNHQTARLR